jgi:hypothetical protein
MIPSDESIKHLTVNRCSLACSQQQNKPTQKVTGSLPTYLQNINFIRFIFHTINGLNFIYKYNSLNLQNKHATICLLPASTFPSQLKQAL